MKKLFSILAIAAIFTACNNDADSSTSVDSLTVTTDSTTMMSPSTMDTMSTMHMDTMAK